METETKFDIQALTREVARYLGEPWTYAAARAEGDNLSWLGGIRRPDGAEIILHGPNWAGRGRLSASGVFPRTPDGHDCGPYRDRPKIGVSETRRPHEIAAEIKRRLLPEYLPQYAEAVKLRDELDARRKLRDARAFELVGKYGGTARTEDRSEARVFPPEPVSGELKSTNGEQWDFSVRSLDYEQLVKVLDILFPGK